MSDPTPAEIEATSESVVISYKGQDYVFPSSLEDIDGDVIDAIDDMKLSWALRALMVDGEWARFKKTKPTLRDYGALFDVYASKIGLGSAGE